MIANPSSVELLEILKEALKDDISPTRAKAVAMALRGIAQQIDESAAKEDKR